MCRSAIKANSSTPHIQMLRSFMPTQLHLAYYWLGFSLGSFAVASLDLLGVVTRSSLDISSLVALIFGAGVPCHCRGQQQARLLRLASDCNCFSRWLWNSDVSMHAGNPDRPHPNLALPLSLHSSTRSCFLRPANFLANAHRDYITYHEYLALCRALAVAAKLMCCVVNHSFTWH